MRFAEINQKLKHDKQKFNQSVDELITHIEKFKTQLSELSEKYQKYFNFLHALHLYFRKTMLSNYFDILFRKELKKLTRKFEHIEIFSDERKIRDSDSNKVKKKIFFIDNQMSITSMKMTMCRVRLVETNREIKKNDTNIVKDEVRKTKFRTKKSKNLKIKIS